MNWQDCPYSGVTHIQADVFERRFIDDVAVTKERAILRFWDEVRLEDTCNGIVPG